MGRYDEAVQQLKHDLEDEKSPNQIQKDLDAVNTASDKCSTDCPEKNRADQKTLILVKTLTDLLNTKGISAKEMLQDINNNAPIIPYA